MDSPPSVSPDPGNHRGLPHPDWTEYLDFRIRIDSRHPDFNIRIGTTTVQIPRTPGSSTAREAGAFRGLQACHPTEDECDGTPDMLR
jgi:hypothetical protein